MDLKLLDLFSGIGGFSYAAEKIVGGYKTTQFVEIDPYCQSILHKNFPNIPIHDDIKTFKAKKGQFDVLTAGFPCQDLSVAGRQKGIGEGTRSGLFYEIIRLLGEIQPKFVLFENVRNLLSHEKGATFQEILFQIAKAGYDAEWSVISAKDLGACHKRERIWILAYTNNYGSSSSKRLRVNGEADSNTQERQDKISKSERGSKSSDSGTIQHSSKWRNSKHRLNSDWRGYASKPTLRRGDDGLSNRISRIRSLGNSIVPQCAAVPLQRIKDLIKEKC